MRRFEMTGTFNMSQSLLLRIVYMLVNETLNCVIIYNLQFLVVSLCIMKRLKENSFYNYHTVQNFLQYFS
jgi:hypothetical protein